jgi:uncharacterized protein DUF2154/cell wall-active antibiotic response 4TMS protein YvqF
MLKAAVAVLIAGLGLSGCVGTDAGAVVRETKSLELDKSELVRFDLRMGAGELRLTGGSPKLLDADFEYGEALGRPSVVYHASGSTADVIVDQESRSTLLGNSKNRWNIRLNDSVPAELALHLGAGAGHFVLGSVNIRRLEVNLGVGEAVVDLRGTPSHSYTAEIHGGVGEATVYVPRSAAISLATSHGLGDIKVSGLEQQDHRWVNPDHESAPVVIQLDVRSGIGEIRVSAE